MNKEKLTILLTFFTLVAAISTALIITQGMYTLWILFHLFRMHDLSLQSHIDGNDVLFCFASEHFIIGIVVLFIFLMDAFFYRKDLSKQIIPNLYLIKDTFVKCWKRGKIFIRCLLLLIVFISIVGVVTYIYLYWVVCLYASLIFILLFTPSQYRTKSVCFVVAVVALGIFYFYGEALKKEVTEIRYQYIFQLDDRTITTSEEIQIIFWGNKEYIFKNLTTGELDFIPIHTVKYYRRVKIGE